jgi:hypothetical protein
MNQPPYIDDDDRQAIALALGHFLSDRIDEGRLTLASVRPEVLAHL